MSAVTCSHLDKSFGDTLVLRDVSLDVGQAELVSLLGFRDAKVFVTVQR